MVAKQTAVGKRQKIAQSNKAIFIWISGMSALVGVCAVLSWFLIQQLEFHTRVANKTGATASTIRENIKTVEKLRDNIRLLEVNSNLNSAKSDPDSRALQVILDALPADSNDLALGASLQQKLITPVNGVTIETLSVGNQVAGTSTSESSVTGVQKAPFVLTLTSTDVNALKEVLANFERSIRTIDIDNFTLEKSETKYKLTLNAHAYYQPATVAALKDKVEKP
jgi:hypothetical protein